MNTNYQTLYIEEALGLLYELEASLAVMKNSFADIELISKVHRALHTIKGSGAMFGFDHIALFSSEIEAVFKLIRNGDCSVTPEILDATLKSCDIIKLMLHDLEYSVEESDVQELIHEFKQFSK